MEKNKQTSPRKRVDMTITPIRFTLINMRRDHICYSSPFFPL